MSYNIRDMPYFEQDTTMEASNLEKLLSRSKSMGFLDKLDNDYDFKCFSARFCGCSGSNNVHTSVSSIEGCFEYDWTESAEETKLDSGIDKSLADGDVLFVLDQKIEKLSVLLEEQHKLLMTIKGNYIGSKARSDYQLTANKICAEDSNENENKITNEAITTQASCDNGTERDDEESPPPSLPDTTEFDQDISLDHIIKVALENFLQSDDLKDHVAASTAECVRTVVHGSFCRVVSNAYLPMVERSHRRLVKHVTKLLDDSFADLKESIMSLFYSVHKTSRNIRMTIEKHQDLLEATDPIGNIKLLRTTLKGVLEEELKTWRGRVVQELTSQALRDSSCESESSGASEYVDYSPTSPVQPANPETSLIDTLMRCALINKHVVDGDVNGAFEEALSSADLSLVMAACRAADSAAAVCALRPAVLLSLLQQLATDMVHDTQLKCRYLEEAILSLDQCDTATREYLPFVVGEVRKYLIKFLHAYPKHHAGRRVALIVMAANNLLK